MTLMKEIEDDTDRHTMLMDWKNIVKMTPLYSYPQFTNKHMMLIFFLKDYQKITTNFRSVLFSY